jgi:hypothetical protein
VSIVIKHVFICSNPYIYTTVVHEVYNRDRSQEVDDVDGLAAAATKHLELLKQKDKAESSFIIEKIVVKLLSAKSIWTTFSAILEQESRELSKSTVLFGEMGLGQAEQQCTPSEHMYSCLDSDVHLTGPSLALVEDKN